MCEMAEHCGVDIDFTDVFKQFAGSDDPEATLGRDKIEKALKVILLWDFSSRDKYVSKII